jgi:acyl-CoA synthetase (AMP-forming)/AMP-acid ligase II
VALLMENKPEYVAIWLGLSKLGVITALINTNLTGDSLYHCINVAKAKMLIYESTLEKCKSIIIWFEALVKTSWAGVKSFYRINQHIESKEHDKNIEKVKNIEKSTYRNFGGIGLGLEMVGR